MATDLKAVAIITDAHQRTALYVANSLSKRGVSVVGLYGHEQPHLKSKCFWKAIKQPEISEGVDSLIKTIDELECPGATLIPISMESISCVLRHRDSLAEHICVPPQPYSQFHFAANKSSASRAMSELGVALPQTWKIVTQSDLDELDDQKRYPLILKLTIEDNTPPIERFGIAQNKDEANDLFHRLIHIQPELLAQEYIVGVGVGISLFSVNGLVKATFAHRRIREQFEKGGPSTFCESFQSSRLQEIAYSFAAKTGWNGLVMLEFKHDIQRNNYVFLEANPRFWGSVQLPIRCGVDFPWMYYRWARGLTVEPIANFQKRRRLKYLNSDIHAFRKQNEGKKALPKIINWIRYIFEFMSQNTYYEETAIVFKSILRAMVRKIVGRGRYVV